MKSVERLANTMMAMDSGNVEHEVCPVCHQPKWCDVELMGQRVSVPCLCKCEEDRLEADRAASIAKERAALARRNSYIRGIDLDAFDFSRSDDCAVIRRCRRYVEKWDEVSEKNLGLLLYGPTGTGKTFAAMCIASALLSRGCSVAAASIPSVIGDLQETNAFLRAMADADVVVLDDIGAERQSSYGMERVYAVVDARYRAKKPLIVTTNLDISELEGAETDAHKRIYDRICEMCVPMRVDGSNRRKFARIDKGAALREIIS